MSNIKYNIFYVNLKKGVTAEDAIEKLAKLPKISHEKAKKIICSKNRIIKSGLNKKDADIYRSYLDKIGLCVEIHVLI
jgi:ribosomal protein L7/L12